MQSKHTCDDDVRVERVHPEVGSSVEAELEAVARRRLQRAVADAVRVLLMARWVGADWLKCCN